MTETNRVLFVVSKSTGYVALKSFLEVNISSDVTVLALDDRGDVRTYFDEIMNLSKLHNIIPTVASGKNCLATVISAHKPNLVFVCGWYWMISDDILRQVPLGFLGVHNSLLPKYRGHAPLVWSLINGDDEVGASLFEIVSGMDTGNVFHQWKLKRNERYLTEVLGDLDILIESELGQLLLDILNENITGYEQDNCLASYSAKRRPEDGIINWEQSSQKIILKIKALNTPYPHAFTFINRKKVFIQKAEMFEYPTFGCAGQVVFANPQYAVMSCGHQQGIKILEAVGEDGEQSILELFHRLSSPPKYFESDSDKKLT